MSKSPCRAIGRIALSYLGFVVLALLAIDREAAAQSPAVLPRIVMGPPAYDGGKCFRELFADPDGWRETRSFVDALVYSDLKLNEQFKDDELQSCLAQIKAWNLKLELEVGAVKEWGGTGEKTFKVDRRIWERVERLGGSIHSIAMDEPLVCVREHLHQPDEFAVEETANFIVLARTHFPKLLIGDIETYPSVAIGDHFLWIEALNKKLAERGVRGLDFYRLDVNWVRFAVAGDGDWRQVKKLEIYCRQHKLPFSLTYWNSSYPPARARKLADDSTWQVGVMQQGYEYAIVDGRPDQVVIQSWEDTPSHALPETTDFTFTHLTRDFIRKFAQRGP
jgi:hypothetical protein